MTHQRKLFVMPVALALFAAVVGGDRGRPSAREPEAGRSLPASSLPARCPVEAPRAVVVHKAERVLGLYLDGELAGAFPIGLGRHPKGTKTKQGDGRTPEGRYYVCTRNGRSRFHLFLGVSYPSAGDAERALAEKRLSKRERDAIVAAERAGRQPPWNTPLGGAVGIHGSGAQSDWTLGCIALDNGDVETLWRHLRVGDPVLILP